MSSVTLASLEALGVGLAPTGTACFKRWTVIDTPFKTEYIFAQVATGDDFTNDDTVNSILAKPVAASVESVNTDLGGTAFAGSVSLDNDDSSATFKTITLRDITTATGAILIKTVGF